MSELSYRVEIDSDYDYNFCASCGRGILWNIVAPNGVALGRSYSDKDDAKEMAKELSLAYEMGRQNGVDPSKK